MRALWVAPGGALLLAACALTTLRQGSPSPPDMPAPPVSAAAAAPIPAASEAAQAAPPGKPAPGTIGAAAAPGTAAAAEGEQVRFVADDDHPLPLAADADWLAAWPAWLASCRQLASVHNPHRAAWDGVCAAALVAEPRDGAAVRDFFLQTMDRYRVLALDVPASEPGAVGAAAPPSEDAQTLPARERDTGLVTGYYEIRMEASRVPGGPYVAPVFAPPDPVPTAPRAELLASGALRGHELLWLRDPVEAFFLEVQGSGRAHLPDGRWVRLAYAASNGQPYRSIGRWLLERGELEPGHLSMQAIIEWAQAHPQRVPELLGQNPRMVFFRELDPDDGAGAQSGPIGSLGVALTAGASVAVDPHFLPLGAPLLLSTVVPGGEAALVRPVLAQDAGGAIRGALRVDWFWGSGAAAGELAGRQHAAGTVRLFVPRGVQPRELLN